jgi:outer membrane protein assembly factor BamA
MRAHPVPMAGWARTAVPAMLALWSTLVLPATNGHASPPSGWPEGSVVAGVSFRGLTGLSESEARRLLGIQEGTVPDSAALAQGAVRLAAAFETRGWLTARVDSIAHRARAGGESRTPARRDLVVHVSPGRRHVTGRVVWHGLSALTETQARGLTGLAAGTPFRPEELERGIGRLLDAYDARARPQTRVLVLGMEPESGRVNLTLQVVEGDSVVVRELVFDGLRSTRRDLLEKTMGNVVGLPYNRARLEAARQRILDLGLFSRVGDPVLEDAGRVRFELEENRANAVDGAIGYQGESKTLTGLVDVELGNLGGRGRQAVLRWEGRGRNVSEFRLGYAEPLLFGRNLRAEIHLQQLLEDTLYTRTSFGGRLRIGGLGSVRVWLGVARDRTVLDEGPIERATASTTELGVEYDRRDDRLVPRRGARVELTTATRFEREFRRPTGDRRVRQGWVRMDAQANRPLGNSTGARLELEGAIRLSSEPVIPLHDLDAVGGAYELRGYREDEFRASRWGVARFETGVFLAGQGRAFAFLDQGYLYRRFEEPAGTFGRSTLYRVGYGVGLEAPSGLGLIGLSLGYGRGDGPLDGKLHLRLRSRF